MVRFSVIISLLFTSLGYAKDPPLPPIDAPLPLTPDVRNVRGRDPILPPIDPPLRLSDEVRDRRKDPPLPPIDAPVRLSDTRPQ